MKLRPICIGKFRAALQFARTWRVRINFSGRIRRESPRRRGWRIEEEVTEKGEMDSEQKRDKKRKRREGKRVEKGKRKAWIVYDRSRKNDIQRLSACHVTRLLINENRVVTWPLSPFQLSGLILAARTREWGRRKRRKEGKKCSILRQRARSKDFRN